MPISLMGKLSKLTIVGVAAIWASLVLAIVFWNYVLVYRTPAHAQSAYESQRRLPAVTTSLIDLFDSGVVPWASKIWAAFATVALLWKRRDDRSKFRFPHSAVIGVFVVPLLAVSVLLLLPEFI
jgi:hypothetical protein